MEVGLGIHGEPGAQRCPLQPADQCVDRMLTAIAKPVTEGGSGAVHPQTTFPSHCILQLLSGFF